MDCGEYEYIWQHPDWPRWSFDHGRLGGLVARVHLAQGRLLGRMQDVGFALRDEASLRMLTDDVLKTSEIEGERLNHDAVRSSVARRLGLDIGALAPVDRGVEGVVEMVLDATTNAHEPLTEARLFAWHGALFPTGYSGLSRIRVGAWRDDGAGPMQVVSGPLGRQKVHFEAPPAASLPNAVAAFLGWFNGPWSDSPVIKAGLAHLWFVTLHPFDDGNGRIARAVGDRVLSQAEQSPRFYSLSAQIQRERKDYYDQLEQTQKGGLDVTDWLVWFLGCLLRAIEGAQETLGGVLNKARFWQRWGDVPMNERQIKLLNRLLDGFVGKLTSGKWAAVAKCSSDTALRDISDLLAKGVLVKAHAGGRSSAYELAPLA